MAKIYTRTGDKGQTGLFTGERVPKDDMRMEALGAVDELVAALGLAKAELGPGEVRNCIGGLQTDLYLAMADIASASGGVSNLSSLVAPSRLPPNAVEALEAKIDSFEGPLPELKDFIMPGDSRASAALHLARTVCRRAERRVVEAARQHPISERTSVYLNRLSDLLFVLARYADHQAGGVDQRYKDQR